MFLKHFKLHHWPGLTFGLFLFTFIVSYVLAVFNGHIYPLFPYISDTGTQAPESCFFSQLFNLAAISLGITLYLRYRYVRFVIQLENFQKLRNWNIAGLVLTGLIVSGISICGNFQELEVPKVHYFGAILTFTSSPIYFIVQTYISYAAVIVSEKDEKHGYGITKNMLYFRVFLTFAFFPMLVIMFISANLSYAQFKGDNYTWWTEEESGFHFRLISTFSEWIYTILMLTYIATFTNEFKELEFEEVKLIVRRTIVEEIDIRTI